jgi:hypothetical protein
MIFINQHIANRENIKQRKQRLIDLNNKKENVEPKQHVYELRDKFLRNRGTEQKIRIP